ncbi:MAG: CHASE2 domain-containing protein [Microcoleaceae cyanobacterium]
MMNWCVVLDFGYGSCSEGFQKVGAQIWDDQQRTLESQIPGSLPPAPDLPEIYQRWQSMYKAAYQYRRFRQGTDPQIQFDIQDQQPEQYSEKRFKQLCDDLKQRLNQWLSADSFQQIYRHLLVNLAPTDAVRIIVETEDLQLRRLPWHLWGLLENYPQAEVALSALHFSRIIPQASGRKKTRVLAVLGNSQEIDTERDRQELENLPQAQTVFLVEPNRQQLNDHLFDARGWDILFFAGHSFSGNQQDCAYIEINSQERLTLIDLQNALRKAIAQGLQLAIFNSCDGLGLARTLADLQIPQLIVMREPVPDRVAQEFLTRWLKAFSTDQPLYQSVRHAREQLQGLEDQFPCASWLPVICQNPTADPPTWKHLRKPPSKLPPPKLQPDTPSLNLRSVGILSAGVMAAVVGLRLLGGLEFLELKAFDFLMRSRPPESPDSRLLVITLTGQDVQSQPFEDRQGGSFSNAAFDQLLQKLIPLEPRVIGVDIYRRVPVSSQYATLLQQLKTNNRLITTCKVEDDPYNPGIPAAPEIATTDLQNRVGFSDVIPDSDQVIRRHLLGQSTFTDSLCPVSNALSLMIALRYLADDGIELNLQMRQLGKAQLPVLEARSAAYQRIDARGYQIMVNYRNAAKLAEQLTLTEALEGELTAEQVKDKIVLIGTTDSTFRDLHRTPYSTEEKLEMPGVLIQAHMVSQLLNAAKDGRPLIWWWPVWAEVLWIGTWSGVGGLIAYAFPVKWKGGLVLGLSLIVLSGVCYVALWRLSGWIPWIPALVALLLGNGVVWLNRRSQLFKL